MSDVTPKRQTLQHKVLGIVMTQFEQADPKTKTEMVNRLLDFCPEEFLLGIETLYHFAVMDKLKGKGE
jgi:hypothetical protein